ncbi:MAG: PilZ domain-containing protein, partial [Bradyrhizobium sp.]|nr:PilZ domain-containing protein [Bradyrhizobium sp.]
ELRRNARFVPPNPHSTLTLSDSTVHSCFIIDCSVSGVAVSTAVQPPLGMPLAVGSCVGRVVRLLPNGIAVKFIEQQTVRDLERLVVRAVPVAVKINAGLPEPVAAMSAVMV